MAKKLNYTIEFVYSDDGQLFQTGADLTERQAAKLSAILRSYEKRGLIDQSSVTRPQPVNQTFNQALGEIKNALNITK